VKIASLVAIASALGDADVRYLIVGGLAVAAHGYGRVTFDLDLVLQMQPENLRRAMAALESLGYRPTAPVPVTQFTDETTRQSWIRDKNMVVFQMQSPGHAETPIDLFVTEPFDFDQEYETALIGELEPGLSTRFVAIDALIRMKEAAGRDKDREDVRQLRLLQQDDGNDC
jgi:hypothetical protein